MGALMTSHEVIMVDHCARRCFNGHMQDADAERANLKHEIAERKEKLSVALAGIRRKMEGMMAENQRLREVVRLAENELRKRRDQVHRLENDLHSLDDKRREASGRVEHTMEKLDHLIIHAQKSEA